ncbi:MTHFR-domain-containing protein [Ascobolus immersus RN42]|uniref:MTHFR-domain-containing protein n=1 Tax=Ascobolus immersus RN42 TaxID=1160509 RepID=A0A3N4IMI7_ASCIM|nr:MTHFR-domain-containing protein [Ascobolus immersus RN42]
MGKITDHLAALGPNSTYFSLEVFPPKTDNVPPAHLLPVPPGTLNLHARLERMSHALHPLFINVTWGAGGSTASKSLQLATTIQRDLHLTTCLHLTCTNMSRSILDDALAAAKEAGIRNILALRGDPPRAEEYGVLPEEEAEFVWAVDLVRYIRKTHGDYFCIGVAAYPEGHAEGTAPDIQDPLHDLPYLVTKVEAGADFIMTQLFYDVDKYIAFEKLLRSQDSLKDIPIIPGLMPIQSYQILMRTTKLSHATIPDAVMDRIEAVKGDDEKVKEVGIDVVSGIVERLKSETGLARGPRGFHFYTLNLEKAVALIVERTGLIPDVPKKVIVSDVTDPHATAVVEMNNRALVESGQPRIPEYEAVDSEVIKGGKKAELRTQEIALAITEGQGTLGREAIWDDFPNGRFGDPNSPAFGQIDGYGPSLHVTRTEATSLWGYPVDKTDITTLFTRNLLGTLRAIPWSEQELSAETKLIQPHLLKMNEKGWWTVASQPDVPGVKSDHEVFGWGPKKGWVFQKAFVEFFIDREEWEEVRRVLDGLEDVSYYAADAKGNFTQNASASPGSMNSVTWGCFPGKEIVSTTIIEEQSFQSWAEEAFGIWKEWAYVFPPKSATREFLFKTVEETVLVNVICHDYMTPGRLWEILGV